MPDRGDLQRLLAKLGAADEDTSSATTSASLFDELPCPQRDLGPLLSHIENNHPTWAPHELPTRKHSRFGRTCNRMSEHGATKTIAWRNQHGNLRQLEVCPCGARRQIHADGPEPRWSDINAALNNPNWPTIRTVSAETHDVSPPPETP